MLLVILTEIHGYFDRPVAAGCRGGGLSVTMSVGALLHFVTTRARPLQIPIEIALARLAPPHCALCIPSLHAPQADGYPFSDRPVAAGYLPPSKNFGGFQTFWVAAAAR